MSMDWFKGKSIGNHSFFAEKIWGFPVKKKRIQSIEDVETIPTSWCPLFSSSKLVDKFDYSFDHHES